jgi:3-hydroxyisobutyrate dehydrogenase-like beta-hydroxyacid dehydrogenase
MADVIALIGYGEAGQAIGKGLAGAGASMRAYDLRHGEGALQRAAKAAGIALKDSADAAITGADFVFSLVTAGSALDAARSYAKHLRPRQTYIDFNSVSPLTKRGVAEAVTASGAEFVEAAIMAPVSGPNHRVPVLLSGAAAPALAKRLGAYGMRLETVGERVGDASLNKMLRSIFIKGIDALILESLVAARRVGIEERILDSVQQTFPGIDWHELASYSLSRTVVHAARRAAEMHESAATVAELGLEPLVTEGIARRIEWAHEQLKDVTWPAGEPRSYEEVLSVLEAKLGPSKKRQAAE